MILSLYPANKRIKSRNSNINAILITPFVRSAAVQSNSSNASSWDCKTGKVFNNLSEFMVRKTPSSLLKHFIKINYYSIIINNNSIVKVS